MDYFVLRFDHGYEKADYLALQKVYRKTMQAWWQRLSAVLMLLAAIILLLGGVMMAASDDEAVFGSGIWAAVMGVLLLALFLFRTRINAWAARRQTMETENLTVKFSAEYITETSSRGAFQMPYSGVMRIFSYKGRYFLFLDKRHAHILPEAHFAVGDPKDFPAFIEDRTGKRIEYI